MSRAPQLGPKQLCPHCDAPMMCRTSQILAPVVREITYQCTDVECGYVCVAHNSVQRTLVPSAKPRAGVHIRLGRALEKTKSAILNQLDLPFEEQSNA